MSRTQDIYGEPTILVSPTAVVRVYHPILTEEERAKRMQQIHDAFASLILEANRARAKRSKTNETVNA